MSVVVLYVIKVRLIKNCAGVVIAVWVFVANPPHLVHYLGLRCIWTQRNLVLINLLLIRRGSEVLASQQQHLLVETANYWYLGLMLFLFRFDRLRRHILWVFGDHGLRLAVHHLRITVLIQAFRLKDVLLVEHRVSCHLWMVSSQLIRTGLV